MKLVQALVRVLALQALMSGSDDDTVRERDEVNDDSGNESGMALGGELGDEFLYSPHASAASAPTPRGRTGHDPVVAALAAAPTPETRGPKTGKRDDAGNLIRWFDTHEFLYKYAVTSPMFHIGYKAPLQILRSMRPLHLTETLPASLQDAPWALQGSIVLPCV